MWSGPSRLGMCKVASPAVSVWGGVAGNRRRTTRDPPPLRVCVRVRACVREGVGGKKSELAWGRNFGFDAVKINFLANAGRKNAEPPRGNNRGPRTLGSGWREQAAARGGEGNQKMVPHGRKLHTPPCTDSSGEATLPSPGRDAREDVDAPPHSARRALGHNPWGT